MSVPDGFSGGTWSAIVFVGGGNALGQLFVTCRCVYYASVSSLIGSAETETDRKFTKLYCQQEEMTIVLIDCGWFYSVAGITLAAYINCAWAQQY
jgi:hypothetical protein